MSVFLPQRPVCFMLTEWLNGRGFCAAVWCVARHNMGYKPLPMTSCVGPPALGLQQQQVAL